MPENFAVIYLKFKQRGQSLGYLIKNDANGIANSEDPDQSDLGLHCLPRPFCPKTQDHLGIHVFTFTIKAWSYRRTDMYRKENGHKYAEFVYPVTKFISSAPRSSRDRYVEPRS